MCATVTGAVLDLAAQLAEHLRTPAELAEWCVENSARLASYPAAGRQKLALRAAIADVVDVQRARAELVPLGSAGYKTVAVARGEVDAYVHSGGQYQWDSAAPVAIARAAGLVTCRLDGSPLRYNGPDPSLPDLLVCRPELAAGLLAAVR